MDRKKDRTKDRTKELWGREIKKNNMLYPNERVVSFLHKNFNVSPNNIDLKALDIGFGSGRHLKLLDDFGMDLYGIDYNESCKETCEKLFSIDKGKLKVEELKNCNFDEEYFDVVIALGVLFYKELDQIKIDLKKIHSLMKKNGKMILNFRSDYDFLYNHCEFLDNNTGILNYGPYKGMTYTFLNKSEVENLLKEIGFVIENFEREDYYKNNLEEHHSWWIVSVKKE